MRTPPASGDPEHRLVVQRQFDRLPDIRNWVTDHAAASGVTSEVVADLALAVSELTTNAIQHDQNAEDLVISCGVDHESFVIQVSGADTLSELPTLDPARSEPAGRGLRIVNSIMDDVALVRSDEQASIRCTKRLA